MGLGDLFDFDVSYRIPEFQRPYAWSEEQWEALWDDVEKVAERILRAPDSLDLLPHVMGSMVVQPRDGAHSGGAWLQPPLRIGSAIQRRPSK